LHQQLAPPRLPGKTGIQSAFFLPRPPALPAFRAISLRCSGVKFSFRFLAPRFPSATAAGFFLAMTNSLALNSLSSKAANSGA